MIVNFQVTSVGTNERDAEVHGIIFHSGSGKYVSVVELLTTNGKKAVALIYSDEDCLCDDCISRITITKEKIGIYLKNKIPGHPEVSAFNLDLRLPGNNYADLLRASKNLFKRYPGTLRIDA